MSIYSNLFIYRPRLARSPYEDFLTAALADILNRLPREEAVKFVADVLLAGHWQRQQWLDFAEVRPIAQLRWVTQIGVRDRNGGIVDLLLRVDGKDTIVVENKIGAAIRTHENGRSEAASAEMEPLPRMPGADGNQLRTYGNWLAARCTDSGWPGALILLTHYSTAPDDFGGSAPSCYGVPILQVCKWRKIWCWAKEMGARSCTEGDAGQVPGWRGFCHEFAEFLEDSNMTSDNMTFRDVAAAEVFISSSDRINNTINFVSDKLESDRKDLGGGRFSGTIYSGFDNIVWQNFPITIDRRRKWLFGWGIRFPTTSGWWLECRPSLPDVPHAFFGILSSDELKLPLPSESLEQKDIPPGWIIAPKEKDLLSARSLCEFRHDANGLAEDFGEWASTQMKAARPMLDKLIAASN